MKAIKEQDGQHVHELAQDWTWYDLKVSDWEDDLLEPLIKSYPSLKEWCKLAPTFKDRNYLSVRFPDGSEPVMMGSILYKTAEDLKQDEEDKPEEQKDKQLYFYLDNDVFITFNLDQHTRELMLKPDRIAMMKQCSRPIEGMFILARAILHYFHAGMDRFEAHLREVESIMRKRNARNLMDQILSLRFELLFWHNLFIPFQELIAATKEGYEDRVKDNRFYLQLLHRVERMEQLFMHYHREIETLISIDDAVSGFRGNEIMKTLTIFTVLLTPATVVGAIWGMNFDRLPMTKAGWGFTAVMVLTLVFTGLLYIWMWRKNWTGDLLNVKSRKKNL
ncbi:CorA-like protein [Paenibacillus algicola]|uniref:CorA-like protein n=1 Tax=Paenibacillus algicola TaxID=2565926 RepID=A0A4P8XU05_9BACL|nr:magnesium transporter CorA family protein [Paenibacillus algicola]QCT04249.1 CorA-like protein [Paenibacillus algicola]